MTTLKVNTITDAAGTGAPNIPDGILIKGSTIANTTTLEYYSQSTEPTSPKTGAIWWDTINSTLFTYTGSVWLDVTYTDPTNIANSGDTAVFAESSYLLTLNISTLSNPADMGNLTVSRNAAAGCSNGYRGLIGGGNNGNDYAVIDYITFATMGNASDFGNLTVAREELAAASDGVYGLFAGGSSDSFAYEDTMDYTVINTLSNASDFGNLSVSRQMLAGLSDKTYGVFGGGYSSTNTIDYVTIATPGNAVDFGDLTVARQDLGACAAGDIGVFTGSNNNVTIDYITIPTPGNATDFGDLSASSSGFKTSAAANDTRGVIMNFLRYDYITIATPGNATAFNTTAQTDNETAALSGD